MHDMSEPGALNIKTSAAGKCLELFEAPSLEGSIKVIPRFQVKSKSATAGRPATGCPPLLRLVKSLKAQRSKFTRHDIMVAGS
jgi:hypothetical protein